MKKENEKKKPQPKKQDKATEYLAGWQRAQADLENFKKQQAAQALEFQVRAKAATIEPLLSLADNFNAIVKHVPEEIADNAWVTGVVYVARQLEEVLAEQGVEQIGESGEEFDAVLHEAIETVEGEDKQSNLVAEVVLPGYRLGEQILRPAKVKVTK